MTKSKAEPKKVEKKKEKVEIVEQPKYTGPTKTFRFLNPEGHPDKYDHITLKDGDVLPDKVKPILEAEKKKQELLDRITELEKDLKDDGKRNFSSDETKKSPGRKKK